MLKVYGEILGVLSLSLEAKISPDYSKIDLRTKQNESEQNMVVLFPALHQNILCIFT